MAVTPRKFSDAMAVAVPLALNLTRTSLPLLPVNCGTATLVGGTVTVTTGLLGSLTGALTSDMLIMTSRNATGGTAGNLAVASLTANQFVINSSSGTDTSTVFWIAYQPCYHKDQTSITSGPFDAPVVTNAASLIGTASVTLASAISVTQQLDQVYRTHLADTVAHLVADATNVPNPAIATVVDQPSLNTYLNALQTSFNAHLTQAGVHLINDTVNNNATTVASNLATSITLVNSLAASLVAHTKRAVGGQTITLLPA
jgi:hypothetical protein